MGDSVKDAEIMHVSFVVSEGFGDSGTDIKKKDMMNTFLVFGVGSMWLLLSVVIDDCEWLSA